MCHRPTQIRFPDSEPYMSVMQKVFGCAPLSIRYAAYLAEDLPPPFSVAGSYLYNHRLSPRLQLDCPVREMFPPDFDPVPKTFKQYL